MELVILSTMAAIAILFAELRDFAGREHLDRATPMADARRSDSTAPLVPGSSAASPEASARRQELNRAA